MAPELCGYTSIVAARVSSARASVRASSSVTRTDQKTAPDGGDTTSAARRAYLPCVQDARHS